MNGMPNIPGLSQIVRPGIDAAISFGGAVAINRVFSNQWGVFNQYGVPVLLVDTVVSVEYDNSSTVASAPVERGTFTSYNKVQDPYTATVSLARAGTSPAIRGAFIAQIEALSRSSLLFHVVTPEYVHRNASITGFSYARNPQQGARMIVANIRLQEVRRGSVRYEDNIVPTNQADMAVINAGQVDVSPPRQSLLNQATQAVTRWFGG